MKTPDPSTMIATPPRTADLPRWIGRALSGLVIAFLLMDAVIKLVPIQPVIETLHALGFQATPTLARGLGAVLLTGYLGGAIAIHVRADSPLFTHVLFGAYVGAMLWAGLLLRDRGILATRLTSNVRHG